MNYKQLEERSQQLEARVAILEKQLEQMKQLLFSSRVLQKEIPWRLKNDLLYDISFPFEQRWRKPAEDWQQGWRKSAEEETVFDTTLAKLQQLPEPLLRVVKNFVSFITRKHFTNAAESQPNEQLVEAWLKSEPFLQQMTDFVDFITHKHLAKTSESQLDEKLVEAWLKWFEGVDHPEVTTAELEEMKQVLSEFFPKKTPWWLKVAGSFENDPTFDEAVRLGQEWRKSAE